MLLLKSIPRSMVLLLSGAAMTLTFPLLCPAAESPTKTYKIQGTVAEVEAVRLTIQTGKGRTLTVHTGEDYRERVVVGIQVTVWYHPQGEINKLDRLEYPLGVSFVPAEEFVPRIKKVILLPSSNAGDADALFRAIEQFLQTRFNWVVSHRMLAEEIRSRFQEANRMKRIDLASQTKFDLTLGLRSEEELVQKIASESRVDAVLETQVERLMVKGDSHTARWDGVQETFGSKGARTLAALSIFKTQGQVPTSTVVMKLRDPQGKLLWSHRRGFCVLALQVGMGNTFRDRPISEAVENTALVDAWLNEVFGSWLPYHAKSGSSAAQR